jgi:hypothetical protein
MPMCNLSKTMHIIWLQQRRKRGACLYVATSNDYVWAFKQSTLYFHLKQGGQLSQGHDKIELFLRRVTQFGDLKQLVNIDLKYSLSLACTIIIAHMEGEEIFGSYKWKANLTLRSEGDSHRHNHVNFSHLRVSHTIVSSSVNVSHIDTTTCGSLNF